MGNTPNYSPEAVPKTWMPTTAGILCIITGATRLMGGIIIFILGWLGDGILNLFWYGMPGTEFIPFLLLRIVAVLVVVLGIVAIVGGVYAIQRRMWGLVLAGSICATLLSWLLGIPAIIFTALSQKEFVQS